MQTLKPKHLVIGGLLLILLVGEMLYSQFMAYFDEIDWYTENLGYDFSATVDSVKVFNANGNGFLYCTLTDGTLWYNREDSLSQHVEQYKRLRLLRFEGKVIKVFSGTTDAFRQGTDQIFGEHSDQVSSGPFGVPLP